MSRLVAASSVFYNGAAYNDVRVLSWAVNETFIHVEIEAKVLICRPGNVELCAIFSVNNTKNSILHPEVLSFIP